MCYNENLEYAREEQAKYMEKSILMNMDITRY